MWGQVDCSGISFVRASNHCWLIGKCAHSWALWNRSFKDISFSTVTYIRDLFVLVARSSCKGNSHSAESSQYGGWNGSIVVRSISYNIRSKNGSPSSFSLFFMCGDTGWDFSIFCSAWFRFSFTCSSPAILHVTWRQCGCRWRWKAVTSCET